MEYAFVVVAPPRRVYRVARRGGDPFSSPPWHIAGEDGTFGNRFDDPSAAWGNAPSERFRVIYCASRAAGAFGETLAQFRPRISLLAKLREISDEETVEEQFAGNLDPTNPDIGVVPADWQLRRVLAETELDELSRFVDLAAPQTHQYFRRVLSTEIAGLGLHDFDLSSATGPHRSLTQLCARHIYDLHDGNGRPLLDGIRYLSRLNPDWECWAIFSERMRHSPGSVATIYADNADLMAICELFKLSIEVAGGQRHFIRPSSP